jgi:acylpyruvate hydrolase
MKLATVRLGRASPTESATAAVRLDAESDELVEIGASDVGALLADPDWRRRAALADGPRHAAASADYAPLVPTPDKIVCVGLNYRQHILEMGRDLPSYPTLFAKYRSALVGAHDDIVLPAVSDQVDWEAELAVIVGRRARHVAIEAAADAIAGYSVLNDVTARDWQGRTLQFLQGKTFESSTPLGPHLVTADDADLAGSAPEVTCEVDGELMQKADSGDLLFGPAALVSYVSQILTLEPGDVIATGTPAGVGAARTPPRFLDDGMLVVTRVSGVGECRNRCRRERLAP